ncbi:MAG: hypothetical protein AABY07_01150 [Nanoarchaeota archaeon]
MTRKQLAKSIRKKSEKYYKKYPDEDLSENLMGLCAISSMALKEKFKEYGYDAKLIHGKFENLWYHCWIESGEEIYDVTATQFDGIYDKVLVTDTRDDRYDGKEIKHHVFFASWPYGQRPSKKKIQELLSL